MLNFNLCNFLCIWSTKAVPMAALCSFVCDNISDIRAKKIWIETAGKLLAWVMHSVTPFLLCWEKRRVSWENGGSVLALRSGLVGFS